MTQINKVKEFKEVDFYQHKYASTFRGEVEFNAPHEYRISQRDGELKTLGEIKFQLGSIKENGVNGAMDENLIAIVIDRLQHFQNSEFKTRQNAIAITKLQEALFWLQDRTNEREKRGVEGTHVV